MKKITAVLILVAAIMMTVLAGSSHGQYYGYWPNYAPGYPVPPPQQTPPEGSPSGLYYRLAPNPLLFRQWDHQIRMWDFLEVQRSPLNPESPLDYLMRTF